MPLIAYKERSTGKKVNAGLILSVEPIQDIEGAVKLTFSGDAEARIQPVWAKRHNPKAGGYFVILDIGADFMEENAFNSKYERI